MAELSALFLFVAFAAVSVVEGVRVFALSANVSVVGAMRIAMKRFFVWVVGTWIVWLFGCCGVGGVGGNSCCIHMLGVKLSSCRTASGDEICQNVSGRVWIGDVEVVEGGRKNISVGGCM